MTDEELIAWLRDLAEVLGKEAFIRAADRIKALTEQLAAAQDDAKEAEDYAEELEADRRKTYEALLKVSRIHGEAEAKLAKAVEALQSISAQVKASKLPIAGLILHKCTEALAELASK